eukprot:scpid99962/ scgid4525/ Transmembrane protein 107
MARPLRTIVPARFLALSAHLAVVIMSFYARDGNIKECLPLQYTASEYNSKDDRLIVGLSFSLGFLAIEFFGFLFGFTMFNSAISLVCILFNTRTMSLGCEFHRALPIGCTCAMDVPKECNRQFTRRA